MNAINTDHLTRQMELIPLECLGTQITIIGAGAIGSFTALALAKMGFGNITVWDNDKIEVENMNCQFYRFSDIGRNKAEALRDLILMFTGITIQAVPARYEAGLFPGVVISAVDNMAVRKTIWMNHVNRSPMTKIILDPRMGAESALLFAMSPMEPKDQKAYSNSLYTDEAAVQERCTAKATMYTACMLSGLVAQVAKDYAMDHKNPLRSAQWSLKDYQLVAFRRDGSKC